MKKTRWMWKTINSSAKTFDFILKIEMLVIRQKVELEFITINTTIIIYDVSGQSALIISNSCL